VHCAIIAYEAQQKVRVIAENDNAIVFAPFASHQPFSLKIFPKPHASNFETTPENVMSDVVAILQQTLASIKENLNDPDLNFFIHTAPLKNQSLYEHYHCHIEVAPKISMQAGLELSTGVLINIVEPETAARMLRGELQ
jgi:UDPglucose--hexose-1-phosphate uridylyltransferase